MGRINTFSLVALLSALCLSTLAVAEVTVLKVVQTIYDRSPKLRIKGTGFDADDHDITLDLSATGQESLKADKDFLITKDDDGIILKLLSARRFKFIFNYLFIFHEDIKFDSLYNFCCCLPSFVFR